MGEDELSDSKLKSVYPALGDAWKRIRDRLWDKTKLQIKITHGFRDFYEQWDLYSKGRKRVDRDWIVTDKKRIVTNARGGESFHNFGLAIDSAFVGSDPYLERIPASDSAYFWTEYGHLAVEEGLVWGGFFKLKDMPHIENSFGLTLHELQMIYEDRGLNGVFKHIKNKGDL